MKGSVGVKRIKYLDGIRGLMAMNVVINHFIVVYYPEMYFENYAKAQGGILSLFATSPLSVLVNGNIAVQFFFALAGYMLVVSINKIKIPTKMEWLKRILHRYIRLLPMVIVATLFTYLLMKCDLMYNLEASHLVRNVGYLEAYNNFEATIGNLLYNIFLKTFFVESDYISPFWTIKYEFIGCIFFTVLILTLRKNRYRRIVWLLADFGFAVVCRLLGIGMWYFGAVSFGLGIVVGDVVNSREREENTIVLKLLDKKLVRGGMTLVGIYLCCIPRIFTGIYAFPELLRLFTDAFYRGVGVSLLLYVIHDCNFIQKFLEKDIFVSLGKLSFSVYAIHWPIMLSLEAGLFVVLLNRWSYNTAAITSFIVTCVVILLVSIVVMKIVQMLEGLLKKLICGKL